MSGEEGFWLLEDALLTAGREIERRMLAAGTSDPLIQGARAAIWSLYLREKEANERRTRRWLCSTQPGAPSYSQCLTQSNKQRAPL